MLHGKSLAIGLVIFGLSVPSFADARNIRIFTQNVPAKMICGSQFANFKCSTTYQNMKLNKADIALERRGDLAQPMTVLGMIYTDRTATALSLSPCDGGDVQLFSLEGDTSDQTKPTTFNFSKKSKVEIDAGLKADVKNILISAGVSDPVLLEKLQADFSTTYKRSAGRKQAMGGSYFRLALRNEVIQGIKNPNTTNTRARKCGSALRSNPKASLIYSIAIIKLDSASYASNVASDAAANFSAKVASKAPNADIVALKASITSSVEKSLNTELGTEYRVVSWDYMNSNDLSN